MINVMSNWNRVGLLVLIALGLLSFGSNSCEASSTDLPNQFSVPVLVVHFFPTNGSNIDIKQTGDWGESLVLTRQKTQRQTAEILHVLQEGSRYRAFEDSNAVPCVQYRVVGSLEFLSPLPTYSKPGHKTPMTDYRRIMNMVKIEDWTILGIPPLWTPPAMRDAVFHGPIQTSTISTGLTFGDDLHGLQVLHAPPPYL
jgi:hypothetical protein